MKEKGGDEERCRDGDGDELAEDHIRPRISDFSPSTWTGQQCRGVLGNDVLSAQTTAVKMTVHVQMKLDHHQLLGPVQTIDHACSNS